MFYSRTTSRMNHYGKTHSNINFKQIKRSHGMTMATILGKHNNVNSLSQS